MGWQLLPRFNLEISDSTAAISCFHSPWAPQGQSPGLDPWKRPINGLLKGKISRQGNYGFTWLYMVLHVQKWCFNAVSSSKNQCPVGSGTLMQLNFWWNWPPAVWIIHRKPWWVQGIWRSRSPDQFDLCSSLAVVSSHLWMQCCLQSPGRDHSEACLKRDPNLGHHRHITKSTNIMPKWPYLAAYLLFGA